jgi:hypothetical protein
MTFRIDAISIGGERHGRWICSFKGFRGQGVYARALLDDSGSKLVIESTMDCNERLVVPVNNPPISVDRIQLHAWIGEQLSGLGWGPEVDQSNEPIVTRALGDGNRQGDS